MSEACDRYGRFSGTCRTIPDMAMSWPFVGRYNELRLVGEALRDPTRRGIILGGMAGVGKSRLVTEALRALDNERLVCLRADATPGARDIPLGAFAHLLPPTAPSGGSSVNVVRWAAAALDTRVAPGRLVLVIDDVHLLDPASATLLLHLVRNERGRVLATVRSGEAAPEPVMALWKDEWLDRVDLAPVTYDDIKGILHRVLGGAVESRTIGRLQELARGNVLFLRELVDAGLTSGVLAERHGVWCWEGQLPIAPRLTELIGARIGAMAADEREVIELVAFGEPLGAELLAGLTSTEAIERVEEKQMISVVEEGRRLSAKVAHPLYTDFVRAQCPRLRARRRLHQLASAVEDKGARRREDVLRVAVWRLDSNTAADPVHLTAACEYAFAAYDVPLAIRLGRAAADAGDHRAAIVLAHILNYAERYDEAEKALLAVANKTMTDEERILYAIARAHGLNWGLGRGEEARQMLRSAEEAVTDPAWRDWARGYRGAFLVFAGECPQALRHAQELLAGPPASPPAGAMATAVAALAFGHMGQSEAAVDMATAALDGAAVWRDAIPYVASTLEEARCFAYLFSGELATVEEITKGSYGVGSSMHTDWAMGEIVGTMLQAQAKRLRGRLGEAMRTGREGAARARRGDDTAFGHVCFGELAHAAAMSGNVATAREALAAADERRLPTLRLLRYWIDLSRPWVAAAGGDIKRAVELALQHAETTRPGQLRGFEVFSLHDVARLGAAPRVAHRLQELAGEVDGGLAPACADQALAAARGDGFGLMAAAEQFERLGMLLYAAEAAAQAADAHRAMGQTARAQESASRAWALAARCEGARTPALVVVRSPGLTDREREIAQLAAGGRSNKAIAEYLVISVRTVENHLQAVYRKLGVAGRAGLIRFFQTSSED